MSVPSNYIIFSPGIPKRIQIKELHFEDRTIVDPLSLLTKTVRTLVGTVISEDGQPTNKLLSITSAKLQAKLVPYMADANLGSHIFTLVKNGFGFMTEYTLSVN